jgi:hypothetical protein
VGLEYPVTVPDVDIGELAFGEKNTFTTPKAGRLIPVTVNGPPNDPVLVNLSPTLIKAA